MQQVGSTRAGLHRGQSPEGADKSPWASSFFIALNLSSRSLGLYPLYQLLTTMRVNLFLV